MMTRRNRRRILLAAFLIFLTVLMRSLAERGSTAVNVPRQMVNQKVPMRTPSPLPSSAGESLLKFREAIPQKEEVREQIRNDPHATPQALVDFARLAAPLVERGKRDEEFALQWMPELARCLADERALHSARAFCLRQARILSQSHPANIQLRQEFLHAENATPVEVRRIEKMGQS